MSTPYAQKTREEVEALQKNRLEQQKPQLDMGARDTLIACVQSLNDYSRLCHAANKKWWHDINTGEKLNRNKGELIALMHSELSECLEGVRKNSMDDKLPDRKMEEVELVDCLIRIFDYAGGFGLDLQGAFEEKMYYNSIRKDHTAEHRQQADGKKF